MLEVDKRAITRAEVIERELHAQVLQLAELTYSVLRILYRRPFGDLEHKTTGVQPGLLQNAGDLLGQIGLLDLSRREVHAQAERQVELRRVLLLPLLELTAGLFQDPQPDLLDQATLLCDLDELSGDDQSPLRASPARIYG